jgi:hypothetical protein
LAKTFGKVVEAAPATSFDPADEEFWNDTAHQMANDPEMKPREKIPVEQGVKVPKWAVRQMLKSLKWKAPGHDNVSNVLLKMGGTALAKHLRRLYQLSLNTGYVPLAWKVAIVVPILKEGKDSRLPESYRPISLLPATGKGLEIIVAKFLYSFLESNGILPCHQFGFRSFRSTVDPIFRFISDIGIALSRSQRLVAVLLDFKAAFDTIWHDGLRLKLKQAGVPTAIVRWISDFLRDRSFMVKVGSDLSQSRPINCGVPQGSPLSPLLFIFFAADMQPKSVRPDDGEKRVGNGTFADDAINWAFGKDYTECASRIQAQLRSTEAWCNRWRLALNPSKCECIIFGYHGSSRPKVSFYLYDKLVPQKNKVKYLGINLTTQLGWNDQLDALSAKLKPRIGALYGIAQRHVLQQRILLLFYTSLVESVLRYAAPAWVCQPPSTRKQLIDLQVHALRSVLDLPFETEPADVLAYAGVESIEDIFESSLQKYGERCLSVNLEMAAYIKHVATLRPETDFARSMLERKCPAWRLRNCNVTVLQSTVDAREWIQFEQ